METVEVAEIVTLTDIAIMCGVSAPAVSNWKKRHADFPEPFMLVSNGKQGLYLRSEVMVWNEERKEAKITRWKERLAAAQAETERLRAELADARSEGTGPTW